MSFHDWICKHLPWLCRPPEGGPGPIGPNPMPPWMEEWIRELNDAPNPPTAEDLSSLANALLAAGYAEEAYKTSEAVLRDAGALQIDLDPMTKASLQLIGVRALAAQGNKQAANDLIKAMPTRGSLAKALK